VRETEPVTWWRAIDTESVSDSGSSITVLVVSLALVALGLALLAVTIWFWRLTRPDPDALGPLVVMSDHDFFQRGPIEQRRSLDAARPGAVFMEGPIESTEPEEIESTEPEATDEDEPEESEVPLVEVVDEWVEWEEGEPDSDEADARGVPIDPLL
jgi:hypothetical protein